MENIAIGMPTINMKHRDDIAQLVILDLSLPVMAAADIILLA